MPPPLTRRTLIGRGLPAAVVATAAAGQAMPAGAAAEPPGAADLSILDVGAIPDDRTDSGPAIQRAIDAAAAAGGGSVRIPAGKFLIREPVRLRSQVRLAGTGASSIIHLAGAGRRHALLAEGTRTARLAAIGVHDLAILGDARYDGGRASLVNGAGLVLVHADDCEVTCVSVTGFSDGGIQFLNGHRNSVIDCLVRQTAQGIAFTASEISVSGNVAVGNRISETGRYNGLHLEGGWGNTRGEVRQTTLIGNTVAESWEAGINIELAPHTSCVGNTVDRSGLGRTAIDMGIKVYGSAHSVVCGNTVTAGKGDAIVIGANSGGCAVTGNSTFGNRGALLLTDSGAQVTNDVAITGNSFAEGDPRFSGNVRLRNRTLGLSFANRAVADGQTLDWYEEGRFAPRIDGDARTRNWAVRDARFTRIGNIVQVSVTIEAASGLADGDIALGPLPFPATSDTALSATIRTDEPRICDGYIASAMAFGGSILLRTVQQGDRSRAGAAGLGRYVLIAGQYFTTD